METTTVKFYSLNYNDVKTYWAALLFIVGNILFPQLFHLMPQGGIIWLPIYFFTLIGAYKYGWKVGLLTAILSPIINSLFFDMPAPAVLPCNFTEIHTTCHNCRLGCTTFRTYFYPGIDWCSTYLSGRRYFRRMDI